jgi:hypothetical protein
MKVPSPTREQDYQENDPYYDIGGGVPPIGIKVSYVWYLKNITSGVIPTYLIVSIKNARFKCQPSTPMQSFVSIRCTLYRN